MVLKSINRRRYAPLSKNEREIIVQKKQQGIKNKDIKKVIDKPLSTIQSCNSSQRKDCLKDYINELSFYCFNIYQEKHQIQNSDSEKKIKKQISKIVNDAIQQKNFNNLIPIKKQQTQKNNTIRRKNRAVQQCLYFVLINRSPLYFQLTSNDIQEIISLSQSKLKNQNIANILKKTLNIIQIVVENYKQENDRKFWEDKIIEKINLFYSDLSKTFQILQEKYYRHQLFENKSVEDCQLQSFDKTVLDLVDANDDEFDLLDSNAYPRINSFIKTINYHISHQKNDELSFLVDQFFYKHEIE